MHAAIVHIIKIKISLKNIYKFGDILVMIEVMFDLNVVSCLSDYNFLMV